MSSEPARTDLDDAELRVEREYLEDARAALRYMYEDVINTETQASAPAEDNDMFLEREAMQLARERRALALVDLPDVPLFFGRLDFDQGAVHEPGFVPESGPAATSPPAVDRVYIGRRHVHDAAGRPMVIDWRAPVSAAFYRASREDRRSVRLRRRFGFSDAAELTAYDDELLTGPGVADTSDAFLIAEIERPRSGPMRDIVATIQPEQDRLVRAPLDTTLCVQGAPGTGKTAVGLHRVAYLLFTERDRLRRNGVVVVGPNRSFLSYIHNVLPALGEVSVDQTTIGELIGRQPTSRNEAPRLAALKGDVRMAPVLRRALWMHVTRPTEGLLYVKGSFRYRVASHEVSEIIAGLRGTTRFGPARETAAKRLAHAVLVQMERGGEVTDDRTHAAVTRSRPVTQVLDQAWPRVTPEQVLFRLFTDAEFLARAARDDLPAAEQSLLLLLPVPPRSPKSAKWSAADCILLDELADLIERPVTHAHIVVDEAQDLTPMQCRAVARRSAHGSLTVLGDIAQATSPGAADGWPVLLSHLGKPDATVTVLDRGYRVPAEIIDYAARLLPTIAPGLDTPTSARQAPGALRVTQVAASDLADTVAADCRERLTERGSVGVITADGDIAGICEQLIASGLDAALLGENSDAMATARLACLPASLAKGLEFDAVIVVEPARIVAAHPRGAHHLYVALTRAVSSLHVLHAEPLPAELS